MLLNVALSWVPNPLTTAMIAIEIPAAIRPYSMAVAPFFSQELDEFTHENSCSVAHAKN
jgi:hypothetical protein